MSDRVKALSGKAKEDSILLLPFALFFYLLHLSPMMYDGWAGPYYYINNGGLLGWIQYVFGPMRNWINGRIASNFFSGIIESFPSEIPLDIIGSLILTGILFCLFELFQVRNRVYATLLYTALIILMPYAIRTYVLQIALIQYLTPVLFILLALLLLNKYVQTKNKKYMPYYYILCVIACTWMENTSVAYGIVIVIYSLQLLKKEKKIDTYLLLGIVLSLISGLFMVLSPGIRLHRGTYSGPTSFFLLTGSNFINHIKNFFLNIICRGGLAHCTIALILFVCSLNTKQNKKLYIHISLSVLNLLMLLAFFLLCLSTQEYQYIASLRLGIYYYIQNREWLLILSVAIYFVWIAINIFSLLPKNNEILFFGYYGIALLVVCLPTNQVYARVISPFYLVMVCMICIATSKSISDGILKRSCLCITGFVICLGLSADYYLQLCNRIHKFRIDQTERIEWLREAQFKGEWLPGNYYILPVSNYRDLYCGAAVAIDSFHYSNFLYRNGLDPSTKILFSESNTVLFSQSITNKGMEVQIIDSNFPKATYTCVVAYCKNQLLEPYADILQKTAMTGNNFLIPAINGEGYYKISVYREDTETSGLQIVGQPLELYYDIGKDASLLTENIDENGITVKICDTSFPDASYTYIVAYCKDQSHESYVDIIKDTNMSGDSFFVSAVNGIGYYKITAYRENSETRCLQMIGQPLEIFYDIEED